MLVLVDTLWPDHLSLYGYARATSRVLDARAADGRVFEQARAPAPWTLPSARALLSADRVRDFEPEDTIAVHVQREGWRTVLLSANPNVGAPLGFHAGWDRTELHEGAPAGEQVERALVELAGHPDHLFVVLHLMDPHLPYAEPTALRRHFAGPAPSPRVADPIHEPVLAASLAAAPLSPAEHRYITDRYDQNVLAVDEALARLWPVLTENDLVMVVSGHGESLGDDGHVGHGHSLDDAVMRVPLVIWGPGVQAGGSTDPVGLERAWEAAGGEPLVSAVQVAWRALPAHAVPELPSELQGLQVDVPDSTGAPWLPPAPLRRTAPTVVSVNDSTWQLRPAPMRRLPAVVYFPVSSERRTTDDVSVQVLRDGAWSAANALQTAVVRVPPEVPQVPLGPSGPGLGEPSAPKQ